MSLHRIELETLCVAKCKSLKVEGEAVLDVRQILKQRVVYVQPVLQYAFAAIRTKRVPTLPQKPTRGKWMTEHNEEERAVLVKPVLQQSRHSKHCTFA